METWKKVPGYEDDYSASSYGRVMRTSPGKGAVQGRILKPIDNGQGYTQVRLKGKFVKLHRLIAIMFLGPPTPERGEVNHKDGCRSNNRADNLEWVNRSENLTHAFRVLGRYRPHGTEHGMTKLNGEIVAEIRRLYAAGEEDQVSLASRFNVCQATIWNIIHRKTWKHVS